MITKRMESAEVLITEVQEEIKDDKPWYYDLKNFLEDQSFPEFATLKDRKGSKDLLSNTPPWVG